MAADPDTAAELVALCGQLPLAIAITAARAAARPPQLPLAVFAAQLRNACQRLDALDGGDPNSNIRAVFSWSCQQIGREAEDLFRLLAIHPGPDITLPAAASLAGTGLAQARIALADLTDRNILTEHRPGRYRLHDLLRTYADEQACLVITADERSAAIRRVLDHYVRTAAETPRGSTPEHYLLPRSRTPVRSPSRTSTAARRPRTGSTPSTKCCSRSPLLPKARDSTATPGRSPGP